MWLAKRGVWSWAIVGMFAVTISLSGGKAGRELRPVQSKTTTDDGDIEVLQLRPNFYMIAGAGGNIGVQVGVDGVVVVDSGSAAKADAVVAAIKKITTAHPIVINTGADPDHVGGNETLAKAGQTMFTQGGGAGVTAISSVAAASILAVEKVLARMSAPGGQTSPFPVGALADGDLQSAAKVHVPQQRRD